MKRNKKLEAFSLVEILVAIGIFTMSMFSVVYFSMDARRGLQNSRNRLEGSQQIHSFVNLITIYKYNNWGGFASLTDQGSKGIWLNGSNIEVTESAYESGDISIQFQVEKAYRDVTWNLATTGTEDIHTRIVTISATWEDIAGISQTIDSIMYINDWNTKRWLDTLESDFNAGVIDGTFITNTIDGEVQLESAQYANWCKPDLTISSYDIPGQGDATTIYAIPGEAYLGTGGNASGMAFTKIRITGVDPPTVTIDGEFDGYKANAVIGDGSYTYLGTDTNSAEITIIDISSLPYIEIGYVDVPGSKDVDAIAISGDYGFAAQSNILYVFDISTKIGVRPILGSIALSSSIRQIIINGDYAFVTHISGLEDLSIIDISNVAGMNITSTSDITSSVVNDLYISENSNRGYMVTESSTGPEFFIINTESKTTSSTVIGSYDASGTNVKGIGIAEVDDIAVLIGHLNENYQVVDISNETAPVRCGGMTTTSNFEDVQIVTDIDGNVFSYIMTASSSSEFQIIRGGSGGGDANGNGYVTDGTFTSQVFDTLNPNPAYFTIGWDANIPANTDLSFQIRTSDTLDFSSSIWTGPDNTNSTYFVTNTGDYIPINLQTYQYVQYKAFFTADTISTPVLYEVYIDYQ